MSPFFTISSDLFNYHPSASMEYWLTYSPQWR